MLNFTGNLLSGKCLGKRPLSQRYMTDDLFLMMMQVATCICVVAKLWYVLAMSQAETLACFL